MLIDWRTSSTRPLQMVLVCLLFSATQTPFSQAQTTFPPASAAITAHFDSINQRILEMAKDFPAEKYDYRPAPGLRSFGEVLVHVMAGNVYAAKIGQGENANWDEIDPKKYHGKAEIVAALEKSISDASAALKTTPEDRLKSSPEPWLSVIEHSAEHYGQLVVYYRNNHMVPPASRPKPQ